MRTGYDLDIFDRGELRTGRLVELVNNLQWDVSEDMRDDSILTEKNRFKLLASKIGSKQLR